jgi:hypothetical protein
MNRGTWTVPVPSNNRVPDIDTTEDSTAPEPASNSASTGEATVPMPSRPSDADYWPNALQPLHPTDYARLTDWQLKILKNFYYARHGYSFPGNAHVMTAVRDWFSGQNWYRPNTGSASVIQARMSSREKSNFAILSKEERRRAAAKSGKKK